MRKNTIASGYFVVVLAALFLFFGASVFAQTDDDVISVETNLIVVNPVVTDASGKNISGLKQKDFQIFEDGKLQEVSLFSAAETPFAAVVLLDTSGSMEMRISIARAAAIKFLDGLRGEDVAAVYNFDTKIKLVQEFSPSRDLMPNAYELKADGWTALNDAIFQAATDLSKRAETRRAIIVLSDGADTKSRYSADKALKAALAANAVIYTVDMSQIDGNPNDRGQNVAALKNFSDKTGGRFVPVNNGQVMRDAFKQIVGELGTQYTLGYTSPNQTKDGKWRTIEVKVIGKPDAKIRARKGYNAPKQ